MQGSQPEAVSVLRFPPSSGKLHAMRHPAVELGSWIKLRRQKLGVVARVFAGQIDVSPAEYAELEAGVVRWLGREQERLIPHVLGLSAEEHRRFTELLARARAAKPLEFSDIFSRGQLEPVRLREPNGKKLTAASKRAIIDAVFTPIH